MKSIKDIINESKGMQIKFISTEDAMFEIFEDDKFTHLQSCIEAEGEAKYDKKEGQWKIQLMNNYNFNDNIYTNPYDDKVRRWLAGYIGDEVVMLQLISLEDESYVELINVEKHGDVKGVFQAIIDFVTKKYHKTIKTFPMDDKLEEYYIKHGFVKDGDELRLDVK